MIVVWIALIAFGCTVVIGYESIYPNYCPLTGPMPNSPRFLVVGMRDSPNWGVGNILAFFPATYFYALLTNRHIAILDSSYMGQFCGVINCGFPLFSTVQNAYADLFAKIDLAQVPTLKFNSFHTLLGPEAHNHTVITTIGMDSRSEWFVWHDKPRKCIAKITGCKEGDIGCAERYAYQQLVVGPFRNAGLFQKLSSQISELPEPMKEALFTLPWSYIPRIDVTVHLRNQFDYFENELDPSDHVAVQETESWLNSSESATVFQHISEAASEHIRSHKSHADGELSGLPHIKNIYVYVAADSEAVKQALRHYMLTYQKLSHSFIKVVTIQSPGVHHIKNIDLLKKCCDGLGLTYLVLDWYLMSLSKTILAWRKGGTRGYSTFMRTAGKVSGTKEPTNHLEGSSVGTRTFHLTKGKNGRYVFEEISVGGIVESI